MPETRADRTARKDAEQRAARDRAASERRRERDERRTERDARRATKDLERAGYDVVATRRRGR